MAGAIGDKGHQVFIVLDLRLQKFDMKVGLQGIKRFQGFTDFFHHLEVGHFTVTADIVGLSGLALVNDGPYSRAVILNIEPVSDVLAISVNGQGLPLPGAQGQ